MPPPLHFSLKMYYNDLTANCSIIFLYVRRWNIYIFQRREIWIKELS